LCAATVGETRRRVEAFHRALSDGLAHAEVPVTASMGACIVGDGALVDMVALMRAADRSMYEAKRSGPSAVRIDYSIEPQAEPVRRGRACTEPGLNPL
jgi:GGDEF domain-containing protein